MIAIGSAIIFIIGVLYAITNEFYNWPDIAQNVMAILVLIGVSLLGTGLFLFAWRYLP